MQLLVIRHGIAADSDHFARTGKPDELRPLTPDGKRKMRDNARGLRRIIESIDVLASSPLKRAAETAAIVSAEFDDIAVATLKALEPESEFEDFLVWLRQQRESKTVAIVGHEPHLGALVTWLLTGLTVSRVPLKKGGACLIEFEGRVATGKGSLLWAATPSLLRA